MQDVRHQLEAIDESRARSVEIRVTVDDADRLVCQYRGGGVCGVPQQDPDFPARPRDIESAATDYDVIRIRCGNRFPGDCARRFTGGAELRQAAGDLDDFRGPVPGIEWRVEPGYTPRR